jgi:EpsI family protein
MRRQTAAVVVIAMLAATAVYVFMNPPAKLALGADTLSIFPRGFGEWTSTDLEFSEVVYDELAADGTLVREYRRGEESPVWFIIIYHENRRYGAHDPMVCYRAQGWDVEDEGTIALTRRSGSFDANWALVSEDGRDRLALYWWYTAGDLATGDRDSFMARMAASGIRSNITFGAFMRASTDVHDGDVESARARLREFSEDALPHVAAIFASEDGER